MGQPKALLRLPDGRPLALHQADRLIDAGASDVLIVLGSEVDRIAPAIESPGIRIACNANWKNGRLSSLQAGLRSVSGVRGAIVLPVDTVGVQTTTFRHLLSFADQTTALAVRPTWQNMSGRILWISSALFEEMLDISPTPAFRMDEWMQSREQLLPVDDPAILRNINTPAEWDALNP